MMNATSPRLPFLFQKPSLTLKHQLNYFLLFNAEQTQLPGTAFFVDVVVVSQLGAKGSQGPDPHEGWTFVSSQGRRLPLLTVPARLTQELLPSLFQGFLEGFSSGIL